MTVPNWAKAILHKWYTLEEPEKIIKYFNMGGEAQRIKDHPHDQKISYLLIEDIFVQAMTLFEYEQINGNMCVELVIHPLQKDGET